MTLAPPAAVGGESRDRSWIFRGLPAAELEWLSPRMDAVFVRRGQGLHVSGEMLAWHYFPADSVLATYGLTLKGATSEYALIGREGYTGMNAVLGDARGMGHTIVLCEGTCLRASVPMLREACRRGESLRQRLLRYASSRMFQMSQTSLCATHHPVERRLPRLLLQAFDRVESPALRLTHDLVATALGVRREAVSIAIHHLEGRGAVASGRGQLTLLSRRRLEALACECYLLLRADVERLLADFAGVPASKGSQAK